MSSITTLIAFDFGTQRIGVAVGQSLTKTANALGVIKAQEGKPHWQQLDSIIKEWQPDALVVGMPLHMDGTESDMSKRCKRFAAQLRQRFALPVFSQDERLSSDDAKRWARNQGFRGRFADKNIDSMAAQLILEAWLNAHNPPWDQSSEGPI